VIHRMLGATRSESEGSIHWFVILIITTNTRIQPSQCVCDKYVRLAPLNAPIFCASRIRRCVRDSGRRGGQHSGR
jgi:hypothetical protein